jgi:hypothetical protein
MQNEENPGYSVGSRNGPVSGCVRIPGQRKQSRPRRRAVGERDACGKRRAVGERDTC